MPYTRSIYQLLFFLLGLTAQAQNRIPRAGYTERNIHRVDYKIDGGESDYPSFNMSVNDSLVLAFSPPPYTNSQGRKASQYIRVDSADYRLLTKMINEANFENLEDDYPTTEIDQPYCILTITYDNGKMKTIEDDQIGELPELQHIYNVLLKMTAIIRKGK